ncbi:MAG: hypothetical protein J7604_05250 [Sporocytophaga sp.]|uniref:hypothetical protein n=1 Tax=Sporocytophaga sp. TaxID=2231183 RepID=UPI001B19CBCA|nr:hypothetical protein [Sporocytophaga sp.]MBO9699595.1 hypothetical protein [Sporocytophaga sp.]
MLKTISILLILFSINILDEEVDIEKRGATKRKEITGALASALKMNNFDMLTSYIPDENEILYLKNHASQKDKYIYDQIDVETFKNQTKENFATVEEAGISHQLNWSETELVDQQELKKNENNFTVFMAVQDMNGKTMKLSYDAIKIKEKWFLFQGIRVEQCLTVRKDCPKQ